MRFTRVGVLALSALGLASCVDREPAAPELQSSLPPISFSFTKFNLGNGPYGSAVTANGTAWIGQITGGTVSKMNVSAGTFTGPYATGPGPLGTTLPVQVTKNGDGSRIYVANFDQRAADSGLVVSINTATGAIVDSVRVMGDATGIISTPTGDTVFVGTTNGPIFKVALATRTIITWVSKSSPLSYHFAWNQNRTLLYASATNMGVVYELNPTTLATVRTFSTGNQPQAIVFSADWTKLFIPSEVASVGIMVWDVPSNSLSSTITTNCRGYGAVRLPDNSKLYVSCTLDGKVVAVNPTTGALLATENVTGKPRELSYDAGTGKVIAPNEDGWVDRVDASTSGPPVGWFVAPGCTDVGNGTLATPWNLKRALSGGGGGNTVAAGDTIWLLGDQGNYRCSTSFQSTLTVGTATQPVSVRPYPGHRVTLDGIDNTSSLLVAKGKYTYFWDLELMNSGSNHSAVRPHLIYSQGLGNKFINLIMHDGGVNFLTEPPAEDVEIAGLIIYNSGWQVPNNRGSGHGLYLINTAGTPYYVRAHDNISFTAYANGTQVSSDNVAGRTLSNIVLTGNIYFNNGSLAQPYTGISLQHNIITGTSTSPGLPMANLMIDSNMTYYSPDSATFMGGTNVSVGLSSHQLEQNATVRNNYIVGGGGGKRAALYVDRYTTLSITGNTIIQCQPQSRPPQSATDWCPDGNQLLNLVNLDYPPTAGQSWSGNIHYRGATIQSWKFDGSWKNFADWDATPGFNNTDPTPITGMPTTTKVFVRHVRYDNNTKSARRAIIAVYNWGNVGSVSVPFDGIIPTGSTYELRNAQAPFATPVTGTYSGGSIVVQITAVDPPLPAGLSSTRAPKLGTRFNAYFINWK